MFDVLIIIPILYGVGVIFALWLSGILIKIDGADDVEDGMIGCVSIMSWVAVIILLIRYKDKYTKYLK